MILPRVQMGRSLTHRESCRFLSTVFEVFVLSLKSIVRASTARVALAALAAVLYPATTLSAATGGSISGAVVDKSGAVIAGAALKLINTAQQTTYHAISDKQGFFSFPNLPVGHYDLTTTVTGFSTQRKTDLTVDTDSALRVDIALEIGTQTDTVEVTAEAGVQVETAATHLGEVVSSSQMTALPLNGRSYTDLLAIQPGVTPVSTLLPSSVIMAGVTGSIDPSGDANPGNLSINGQRESAKAASGFGTTLAGSHRQDGGAGLLGKGLTATGRNLSGGPEVVCRVHQLLVIPAKAGIPTYARRRVQDSCRRGRGSDWIPAFAGMTTKE